MRKVPLHTPPTEHIACIHLSHPAPCIHPPLARSTIHSPLTLTTIHPSISIINHLHLSLSTIYPPLSLTTIHPHLTLINHPHLSLTTMHALIRAAPPWSRVEGKSQVNLPQMPPPRDGMCVWSDLKKNHPFAPGLPPGRFHVALPPSSRQSDSNPVVNCVGNETSDVQ